MSLLNITNEAVRLESEARKRALALIERAAAPDAGEIDQVLAELAAQVIANAELGAKLIEADEVGEIKRSIRAVPGGLVEDIGDERLTATSLDEILREVLQNGLARLDRISESINLRFVEIRRDAWRRARAELGAARPVAR